MIFEGPLLYLNLFIRGAFRVQYRAVTFHRPDSSLNYAKNHFTRRFRASIRDTS